MNQSCKCQCACPEVCMLNHIKNLGIHVTPEDKQRWNTAAEKSSGKDIDIDEYSTTEEVKQLIKDYVDNQGFIKDIPEYYETEEEVLLLLNTTLGNYTRSEDLDETLAQYTTLAALNEFEQSIYEYLELFKQDVLEDTKYVTAMQFSEVSRDLTLTQSDGTTLSVNIPGGGGGSSASAYLMMEAIAYCNVSSDVTPATPEGGSYNFNTYILTPPHDPTVGSTVVWANSQNGMTVDSTHSIYISKRVFSSDPDAPTTSWSQPLLYSGSIQTETTNVQVYSTEVAKVFTVYCEGTVLKITDPVSGEISYKSVPPSNVSHAPEGGTYDRANDTLSSNPHTYGVSSEYWTLNRPVIPSTWTDPDTELSEEPVTFSKACYFSIGTVKSDNSLEWSAPSVYGIDYVIQASNLKFIAIDYSVLANQISLSTDDLAVVAQHVELTSPQLSIIAEQVSLDAAFTTFRGDVSATSFRVFKDNAYYVREGSEIVKKTDVDLKLFSITLNEHDNTTYDPTSANDDVLMLFYNPGTLTGHVQGDPTEGLGNKGTLTGNVLTYTVNPKYISQNRSISYSCALNVEDNEQDHEFLEYFTGATIDEDTAGGVSHSAPCVNNSIWDSFPIAALTREQESNTIVLPDPKINNGLIIKGKVNCNFKLNNTGPLLPQGYTGNGCSNSDEALTQVANQIAVLYNIYYEDTYRNGTTLISWETVCENGLPRITIDTNSDFRFVLINGYDDDYIQRDPTLRTYLNRGILPLDQDFYYDFAQSVGRFAGELYLPLWANVATYYGDSSRYDDDEQHSFDSWSNHMYYIGNGTNGSDDQIQYSSRGIFILPSCTGLWKIANGIPLEYTATAVKESLLNVADRNNLPWDCNVYYWKINTEDFIVYGSQEYLAGTGDTCVRLVPFDEWKMSSVDNTIAAMFNDEGSTPYVKRLSQEDIQKLCYNTNVMILRVDYLSYLLVHMNDGRNNYPQRIKTFIENCVKQPNV